jgi:hypothetical protein
MAVTVNASTSSGLVWSSDLTGSLQLQNNGSTKLTVDSTGAYGQLVQGTAVASTSGTSIDFTSLPAWVKRLTVMFKGVSLSSSSNFLIQVGAGSVTSTGYVSSTGIVRASTGLWTSSTAGFIGYNGGAGYTHFGHFTITNVSSNIWVCSHAYGDSGADTMIGGGNISLGGTLDRVRITTVNGTDTFDAGSVNILYEG